MTLRHYARAALTSSLNSSNEPVPRAFLCNDLSTSGSVIALSLLLSVCEIVPKRSSRTSIKALLKSPKFPAGFPAGFPVQSIVLLQ